MSCGSPFIMKGMNQTPCIEVIAPSSHIGRDALAASVHRLEASGYRVILNPQIEDRLHQAAGTTETRHKALIAALKNPDSDIILAAVGGNRAATILDHIDFDELKRICKPFIGFSDTTSLLNALAARTDIKPVHGPTLNRLARLSDAAYDQYLACIQGQASRIPLSGCEWVKDDSAQGRLIGGNLSVFQSLLGTPYMPDIKGAILFFEDIGDELSRYDRMLTHLRLAGVFDHCAGVIFGDMSQAEDSGRKPFGFSLHDIVQEHCASVNGPVILGAPFGHTGEFYSLPLKCSCFVSRETLEITA